MFHGSLLRSTPLTRFMDPFGINQQIFGGQQAAPATTVQQPRVQGAQQLQPAVAPQKKKRRRALGATTIMTSAQGDTVAAPVARKQLLGG